MQPKKKDRRIRSPLLFNRPDSTPPIRWRLLLLVGLLVFVLVMMRYAGDPNSWRWMGFARPATPQSESTARSSSPRPLPELQLEPDQRLSKDDEAGDGESGDEPLKLEDLSPALAELRQDFWSRLVRRFDSASRLRLYSMFRNPSPSPPPEPSKSLENLVDRINLFYDQYATELLQQSGDLESTDPDRKQLWYDLLFHWQKDWSQQVAPLLSDLAGTTTYRDRPTDEYDLLRGILFQVASGLVSDDTPLGRPAEIPFWNLLVEQLQASQAETTSAAQVTWIELRTQPQAFRGKRVAFAGRIRGARLLHSTSPQSVAPQYYELWVQADDDSAIPFCVFALELPADFPALNEQLATMNFPAKIDGIFFKNRSYLSAAQKTQYCPVVLTQRPQVTIEPAISPASGAPSPLTFGAIVAGIAMLAAWIAFRIYRVTLFGKRIPSSLVAATLHRLENDSQVESVRERLARWDASPNLAPDSNAESPSAE